jgi:excisionase family DNA binding protein
MRLAEQSRAALAPYITTGEPLCIQVVANGQVSTPIRLPAITVRVLVDLLTQFAQGNTVTVLPIHPELTTQEAADLLHVSRPFLVRLLDTGQIPSRKVGTRRRVRYTDLMAYKQHIDTRRRQALDELTAQAQALHLGYE